LLSLQAKRNPAFAGLVVYRAITITNITYKAGATSIAVITGCFSQNRSILLSLNVEPDFSGSGLLPHQNPDVFRGDPGIHHPLLECDCVAVAFEQLKVDFIVFKPDYDKSVHFLFARFALAPKLVTHGFLLHRG